MDRIDKAVSGIPRALATDLGIFDATTTKPPYGRIIATSDPRTIQLSVRVDF